MASQSPVVAVPGRLRGSPSHFHHFLLGYFAPLMLTLRDVDVHEPIAVADCGPLSAHFESVSRHRFSVHPWMRAARAAGAVRRSSVVLRPRPFDDRRVFAEAPWQDLREATSTAIGMDAADPTTTDPGITLIARRPPGSTSQRNTGAARRSIPNIGSVAHALESIGNTSVVSFEGTPLAQQARIMAGTQVVVAQHGAALANLLWCRPGTAVVEINPTPNALFMVLARHLGLVHVPVIQESPHAAVDSLVVARSVALAQRAIRF